MASRPVYSVLIGEAFEPAIGFTLFWTPPVGTKFVIRDMRAFNLRGNIITPLLGFAVQDTIGCFIWGVGDGETTGRRMLEWNGHQVIEFGDKVTFTAFDNFWSFRMSGYQLTTP